MVQRNNRRDSIVQEREEGSAPFEPSSLPRLAAEPRTEFEEEERRLTASANKAMAEYHERAHPPTPRTIDALDLSDFRDLTNAAMAARNKAAGLQQSLQEAQVAQLKAEGAWEGELMRLRRRYGLAENEGFDSETGEIRVVQGQG